MTTTAGVVQTIRTKEIFELKMDTRAIQNKSHVASVASRENEKG
jgi:hypothetical protein